MNYIPDPYDRKSLETYKVYKGNHPHNEEKHYILGFCLMVGSALSFMAYFVTLGLFLDDYTRDAFIVGGITTAIEASLLGLYMHSRSTKNSYKNAEKKFLKQKHHKLDSSYRDRYGNTYTSNLPQMALEIAALDESAKADLKPVWNDMIMLYERNQVAPDKSLMKEANLRFNKISEFLNVIKEGHYATAKALEQSQNEMILSNLNTDAVETVDIITNIMVETEREANSLFSRNRLALPKNSDLSHDF